MAFYKGLSEKSKVHGDDFKNRKENTFVLKYTVILCRSASLFVILKDKDKRSSFNGILQGIE
ncbi:hypothetical protein T4C_9178 [Trichinella pseudospiralis]|uniref:Uncharacterized protein n=1 Tax=Trichinella pseudospiralis TaxID=6337 RepID=A0A0V1GGN4_TRIPS|nr:hypothetical protein T4C_9178 [Trichinella pseudospiralis]